MKQLTKLGMLLAIGAVMVACSNDNNEPIENSQANQNGTTYAAFNIAMPSSTNTKAENDPTFDDGDETEYAVKAGKVILFKQAGSSEDDYIYEATGDLNTMAWQMSGTSNDQITTQSKTAIAKFTNLTIPTTGSDTYYALVILNPNNLTLPTTGDTFGKWRTTAQTNSTTTDIIGTTSAGLTMTNAPEYKSSSYSTLVVIDKSKVSTTSDNNLSPAATIYVQRLAVKVELKRNDNKAWTADKGTEIEVEYPAGITSGNKDKFKVTAWGLDYTNTTTFPVQLANTTPFSTSFTANDASNIAQWASNNTAATFFSTGVFGRLYWAVDPNYSSKASENQLTHVTDVTAVPTSAPILYCMENTMEYDQMYRDQTTSFILKGEYILNTKTAAESFIAYGNVKETIPETVTLKQDITSSKSGKKLSELFELASSNNGTPATVWEAFGVTEDITVDFYKDGIVYYAAPIHHFSDATETPKPEDYQGISSYTEKERGRFGVVRNNWYEVRINKITGLGDPEVPTPDPTDPDDPTDKQYMDITVNILSWAKRDHSYDL